MKSLSEMTAKEQAEASKLTPEEKAAVDAFIAAARKLPKSICISVDDFGWECGLFVSKRISIGSAVNVATLRKKSLIC